MSEYAPDDSSPPQHGSETPLHNVSLEDASNNAANNSIIGKVKSRVSSILPNRLSKWFSPSAKLQNDSLNGSISGVNTSLPARRRRHIEIEEEDNYNDEIQREEYGINHRNRSRNEENYEEDDDEEEEENDDEESQTSAEDYNFSGGVRLSKQTRRDLNVEQRQPPAKRSRLNVDVRDSPLITRRQPLLSSTPAVGNAYLRNSSTTSAIAPRSSSYQRFTNLNLYANQSKRDTAFNFGGQQKETTTTKINTDIIDLISNPPNETEDNLAQTNAYGNRTGISSRRSLNIASSSSSTLAGAERVYATVSQLKRQPLSSARSELSTSLTGGVPPRRTSTTIHEIQDYEEQQQYAEEEQHEHEELAETNSAYNGRRPESDANNYVANKRQKLINGGGSSSLNTTKIPERNDEAAIIIDSASESGESVTDVTKTNSSNLQQQNRKTGLFNMSATGTAANTRNSSRTSSFGNGLNFYSHLEGRKSLFSGQNNHGIHSNPLNNSTLSLTSLNRRQFNASIYGSTSALSDSRLLNTFSPFYKGKTTYGGAAAYNKYTAGAGASAVRITPTLIRPTSSLSTLSSSNNSLATNANSQQMVGDNSSISSTAKRILDLINDFATPLSEAKKMASSLKTNPNLQISQQAKGRLNESDLNNSRAMRLSQVRTPYTRPAIILQPSGNANGRGMIGGPLPPIKELQVPTMSQLLQMKKMQNTTENARKITTQNTRNTGAALAAASEYSLPEVTNKAGTKISEQESHQRHTNKIKNKVTTSMRSSNASKAMQDEEPPPPVNLPNIAFPLMESVPKIDIKLIKTTATSSDPRSYTLATAAGTLSTTPKATVPAKIETTFAFNNTKPLIPITQQMTPNPKSNCKQMEASTATSKIANSFKFSEPLQVKGVTTPATHIAAINLNNYKFSPPLEVALSPSSSSKTALTLQTQQPQLKMGSCLDALSKPFSVSPISSKTTAVLATNTTSAGFGNQFKKSSNEWECDACMIRNKPELNKCVACETPRKGEITKSGTSSSQLTTTTSLTFGQQFKKSSAEWECDTCMIRNKEENAKCVACETPRKMRNTSNPLNVPPTKNSFGDAFKPKSGTWECQTCMITNKNEANECVACQTKKPGATTTSTTSSSITATTSAPQFKFGFAAAGISNTANINSASDASFKTLAAQQKASKWECDACMTRNDANRTKCACCEQPKPGSTNTESSSSSTSATKFTFGATAAAKFSFGFGPAANAPKEEDLKKELAANKTELLKPAVPPSVAVTGGFQFGIKPINTAENKKDETDANKTAGIKFAVSAEDATKISTGFVFGSKPLTSTTATASSSINTTTAATSVSSPPSVKFSLPSSATTTTTSTTSTTTSSSIEKPTGVAAPTFSFGTNVPTTTNSSTSGGFAFGKKTESKSSATSAIEDKKPLEGFAFKTPAAVATSTSASSGLVFGSPTAFKTISVNSSNNTTTTTASSATTAAVKPMFSFGSSATSLSAPAAPAAASAPAAATPAFGGFSFGVNPTTNVPKSNAPAVGNTLFGAVTSTSTATTTANSLSTTTTTPASANIFGSFGGGGGGGAASINAASATPTFGSSPNPPANNSTTVSSSTNSSVVNTPQFGAFGAKTATSSNVFGSFSGGGNKSTDTKPTMPVFGNVASSSTSQSSSNSSGFVFGSSNASNITAAPAATATGSTSTTGSVTSTSATWPKNSFVFGTSTAASTSTTPAATNVNENKEATKPSVFGTFGSSNASSTNQQQATSIFGAPASNTIAPPPAFGSAAAAGSTTNSSTNLFGTNSAPAATSIFGANSSGTAATPAPAFGSSPFGGSASATSATPTFGSTAASGSTSFGGFGAAVASNTTTTNAVAEVKKPEAAFNFGAAPTTTQSTSGGFNFGSSSSSTTKPAFNFGGTATQQQQPTFNFTGTTEPQNSTKPFQFGATPAAPVFNFSRGASEGTPNAPFQFNAGAAPVNSNIFAPTPTPGAQTAQQAKRKISRPIRRVTQR